MKKVYSEIRFLLMLIFVLSPVLYSCAQGVSFNASGIPPDSSAMLDVLSSNKGILIPRLTTAERNAIYHPATGLMIYNLDCNNFNYNAGTPTAPNWLPVNSNSNLPNPGPISGPTAVCPNQTAVAYSIPVVSGASTYTWSVPSGAVITNGAGTNSILVSFGSSYGDVCVSAGNSCGNSTLACIAVSFNSPPTITANPASVNICESSNASFTVTASGSGLTYQWQEYNGTWGNLSNGGVYSNVTTSAMSITGATSGMNSRQYKCVVSGACNPSPVVSTAATLSITALPSSSFTWSPLSPAVSQSCTFSPSVTGATYSWVFSSGTPSTSVSQSPSASWSSAGTYNVSLTLTQNGCSSTTTSPVTVIVCNHNSFTFGYTGTQQTWTVPACITSVTIDARGAQGGNPTAGPSGGLGGKAVGTLAVTAGDVLFIYVGGQNGYNGGGAGGLGNNGGYGGVGGGASDVRVGGTALSNRVIVAGGGGGGGQNGNYSGCLPSPGGAGGDGGGTTGNTGTSGYSSQCGCGGGGTGGGGGTASAGGSPGAHAGACTRASWCAGSAGNLGTGGAGSSCVYTGSGGGGGGGGGYYGGGCGGNGSDTTPGGGGGGGSSYTGSLTGVSTSASIQSGNGQVTITW